MQVGHKNEMAKNKKGISKAYAMHLERLEVNWNLLTYLYLLLIFIHRKIKGWRIIKSNCKSTSLIVFLLLLYIYIYKTYRDMRTFQASKWNDEVFSLCREG